MIKKIVFAMMLAIFFIGCGDGGVSKGSTEGTTPDVQETPSDTASSSGLLPPIPQLPEN